MMENLPKLKTGYYYRVVVFSGVPYLGICSRKVKGIFKKRVVHMVRCKIPISITSSNAVMRMEVLSSAIAMKEVFPHFFVHEQDRGVIDRLNNELKE